MISTTLKLVFGKHMQKNILVDLNVILDVLLARKGYDAAQRVLELSESKNYQLYISAHIVTTFAYLLESAKVPSHQIKLHISWLLETFIIVPIDTALLKKALKSQVADYEDAVVEQAALHCSAAAIITRNIKDFEASSIRALTPEIYLQN